MKHVGLGLASTVALAASLAAVPSTAHAAVSSASVNAGSVAQSAWRPFVVTKSGRAVTPRPVSTTRLIIRAINRDVAAAGVSATQYTVTRVRVARADTRWAAAALDPASSAELDPATVVLRKTNGAWKVVDLGTDQVGCSVAPRKVTKSLRLAC